MDAMTPEFVDSLQMQVMVRQRCPACEGRGAMAVDGVDATDTCYRCAGAAYLDVWVPLKDLVGYLRVYLQNTGSDSVAPAPDLE